MTADDVERARVAADEYLEPKAGSVGKAIEALRDPSLWTDRQAALRSLGSSNSLGVKEEV